MEGAVRKWRGREEHEPDRHAKQHPGTVLLVALDGPTAPQRVEQVRLHDLDRLVALRRDAERQLARQVRQLRVQLGPRRVEPRRDGADWETRQSAAAA